LASYPPTHNGAARLVDYCGGEVGGDNGRGVAHAEEDQGGSHQRTAPHAGDADEDSNH